MRKATGRCSPTVYFLWILLPGSEAKTLAGLPKAERRFFVIRFFIYGLSKEFKKQLRIKGGEGDVEVKESAEHA